MKFHLDQLCLEILHLSLQGSLLSQGSGESSIFRIEQGLQVPQSGQCRLQVRFLLTVPVKTQGREDVRVTLLVLSMLVIYF